MINFVLIEDNDIQRKNVSKIILSYMMNNKIDFKIYEFNDYDKKLLDFIKKNKKDCVYILDLELPNGDGIDVARMIRNECNNWISPIIILTAHASLYYEVYKQRLQILDFISKCENVKKNICENIDICVKMLNKEKVYRFTYKNIDYAIPYNDINYIQRDGRRTKIVTIEKPYYRNLSINIIKNELPNYFIISSKGTIINMKNVKSIDWNNLLVIFKDDTYGYLVSKSHRKELENYEI